MKLDFSNTPMSDVSDALEMAKCQHCLADGKERNYCSLLPKGKQLYWIYPCNYLQELICPRARSA